jgi:ribosomal protein S18 acetylase RimI-like enzyme
MSSSWGVEKGALWALDLPPADGRADQRSGVRFAPAGVTEAAALAAAMGLTEAEVLARLARGSRVIAAWQGDEVASYCWISVHRERVGEHARDLTLPAGESYVWDCATVPRFRGQGLYRSLLRQIAETLAGEGQRRIWIGASSANEASNRTFATVGFRPAASVLSLRVAGRGVLLRLWGASGAERDLVSAARLVFTGRD